MKNSSRKIDTNSKAYRYTLKNFSGFYTEFFILTARNHFINFCGVSKAFFLRSLGNENKFSFRSYRLKVGLKTIS